LSLEHSPNRAGKDGPAFAAPSYTIIEFCEVERMSRSALYKLWAQGKGPRFYFVGNTRRITAQARLESPRSGSRCSGRDGGEAMTHRGVGATQRKEAAQPSARRRAKCPNQLAKGSALDIPYAGA
jgi:hypothetical protein